MQTKTSFNPKEVEKNHNHLLATILFRFAESLEQPQELTVEEAKRAQLIETYRNEIVSSIVS